MLLTPARVVGCPIVLMFSVIFWITKTPSVASLGILRGVMSRRDQPGCPIPGPRVAGVLTPQAVPRSTPGTSFAEMLTRF